jgi:hypothetical protein
MNRTSIRFSCKISQALLLTAAILGLGAVFPCLADTPVADGKKLDFSDGGIWIGPEASNQEVLAARELQTYLYSIARKKLAIRELDNGQSDGRPAIIVGTVKSLPKIAAGHLEQVARLAMGTEEAFDLHIGAQGGTATALILANEPIGALYGAYTFLEKLGIGFYLGGDVYPGDHVSLQVPEMDEFWNPALPIRGCVIWYNFLNGPMTWDLEDYKYFFDQMVKMKANLVSFPEYGYGLTNYESGGNLVPGVPFHTSENYGWGTVRGMKTGEFGFGTGQFFTALVFGSKATTDAKNAQDAIRRSQELFAQAVRYAKRRGIKVCLGFQLDSVPDDAHIKDVDSRLRVLVSKYPSIDYIWFWQCEAGSMESNVFPAGTALPDSVQRLIPQFDYLPDRKRFKKKNRAVEGARMAIYIQKAYDSLKAITPQKRVVISGWGGDKWMFFSDLFLGLDRILPKDVIFSALDNIDPSWEPNVSKFYGELPDDRERWAIPWWESDGGGTRHDQFMPQCNVKPFSVLLPDVTRKGCKGVLGIHWRTRAVEEVARYMVDFAWNPAKTNYEAFYADFARRCFGAADALKMSKMLMELESLGPRWTGGAGQEECQPFTWMSRSQVPKKENLKTLARIRSQLQAIAERDRREGKTQYLDRVERLIVTIDWVTLYDEAAMQILEAQKKSKTDKPAAAEMLSKAPLGKAMQAFTRLLYTQSDWGALATVKVKSYASFEQIYRQCSGGPMPGAGDADLPVQVAFKLPSKIAAQGEPLPVEIVVVGGKAVESVRLYYRALGKGEFVAMPMKLDLWNAYWADIPASAVNEMGLEYYIELKGVGNQEIRVPKGLPSIAVTVVKSE